MTQRNVNLITAFKGTSRVDKGCGNVLLSIQGGDGAGLLGIHTTVTVGSLDLSVCSVAIAEARGRQRREDFEFEMSLDYTARPSLETRTA